MNALRQGDTTTIYMVLSESIGDLILKVGIYDMRGTAMYEKYIGRNDEECIDDTHFAVTIPYDVTKQFEGMATIRCALYKNDKSMVNAAENAMTVAWQKEPVTKTLNR